MLVLSGALAEMAWSVILSKRETFRYIYSDHILYYSLHVPNVCHI
jgi:3-methyladenine DNA glycosylase Tag